jgi:hypothetical protein
MGPVRDKRPRIYGKIQEQDDNKGCQYHEEG